MSCQYEKAGINGRTCCKKPEALAQVRAEMENIFTITELLNMLCHSGDPEALTQCPAFTDLTQNGKNSHWARH